MVDPVPPRTATLAWLQRIARVRSRVGQVWTRVDGYKETLLIIDNPALTHNLSGFCEHLVAVLRQNWCHEVLCLERGERFFMNETWFSSSESGKGTPMFGRVT